MKKYKNFECSDCGNIFEARVEDVITITKCECSGEAKRIILAPRYFSNTTGKSPAANYRKKP